MAHPSVKGVVTDVYVGFGIVSVQSDGSARVRSNTVNAYLWRDFEKWSPDGVSSGSSVNGVKCTAFLGPSESSTGRARWKGGGAITSVSRTDHPATIKSIPQVPRYEETQA